jgi:hypothetical protein
VGAEHAALLLDDLRQLTKHIVRIFSDANLFYACLVHSFYYMDNLDFVNRQNTV